MRRIAIAMALSALAAMAAVASTPAAAQAWPQRPVKLVVPLGPGSGADIGARVFADRLAKRWGQPVVVENRPGGDGVVAINAVMAAKDDHTFLWAPTSTFVGHPYTLDKPPYDPKELMPVARVSSTVVIIGVPNSVPATSIAEFVTLARAQQGKFNFTTATTITDVIMEGYFKKAGIDIQRIAYKDPVSALNDVIEGRLQLYSGAYAIVRSQATSGRLRLLAVMNRQRVPGLDLPTVTEAGFPDLSFEGLVGIIAMRSTGLPEAARDRIAADVRAIASDPTVAERLTATAQIISPGNAAEFTASIADQAARLAETAKSLGLSPRF